GYISNSSFLVSPDRDGFLVVVVVVVVILIIGDEIHEVMVMMVIVRKTVDEECDEVGDRDYLCYDIINLIQSDFCYGSELNQERVHDVKWEAIYSFIRAKIVIIGFSGFFSIFPRLSESREVDCLPLLISSAFDVLTNLPDCTCEARAEIIDHGKLMRLMQFLMGLDDVYQPIRSSILTREILHKVKDAFLIISREESHRGIPTSSVKSKNASSVKSEKPQVSAFVSRFNDNNNKKRNTGSWSNGNNATSGNRGNYDSLLCKNCGLKGHTMDRCFELIGYLVFLKEPKPKTCNNKLETVMQILRAGL
ncbi:hypothetical protein Tco_1539268, partial [Tanacetum coccineum]